MAHRPRKRFGQHFLIDSDVIGAIVRSISPTADDVVIEIGPGQGAITGLLAVSAGTLHAVEIDRDLVARMRHVYDSAPTVTIHEADALNFDFGALGSDLRIVGNLPYNISTPLLFHLLKYRDQIRDMHFMLQKEVVDRMAAPPGSKAYGRLSIMLGCQFQIDALFDVDRLSFEPPPEVTSAVVRLTPLPCGTYDIDDTAHLSRLVATAFSQRRKTIRNSLKKEAAEEDLLAVDIDPGTRPETVPIAAYVKLSNLLLRRENASTE